MTDKELDRKIKSDLGAVHAPEGMRTKLRASLSETEREISMNNRLAENKNEEQKNIRVSNFGRTAAVAAAAVLMIGGGAILLRGGVGADSGSPQAPDAASSMGQLAKDQNNRDLFSRLSEGAENCILYQMDEDHILVQQVLTGGTYRYSVFSLSRDAIVSETLDTDDWQLRVTPQGMWLYEESDNAFSFYDLDMEKKNSISSGKDLFDWVNRICFTDDGSELYYVSPALTGADRMSDGFEITAADPADGEFSYLVPGPDGRHTLAINWYVNGGEASAYLFDRDSDDTKILSFELKGSGGGHSLLLAGHHGEKVYLLDQCGEDGTETWLLELDMESGSVRSARIGDWTECCVISAGGGYFVTLSQSPEEEKKIRFYDISDLASSDELRPVYEDSFPAGQLLSPGCPDLLIDDKSGNVMIRPSIYDEYSEEFSYPILTFNIKGGEYGGTFGWPIPDVVFEENDAPDTEGSEVNNGEEADGPAVTTSPVDETEPAPLETTTATDYTWPEDSRSSEDEFYDNAGDDIDEPLNVLDMRGADFSGLWMYRLRSGRFISMEPLYGGGSAYRCTVYDTDGETVLNSIDTDLGVVEVLDTGFALTTVKNGKELTPDTIIADIFDDSGNPIRRLSCDWRPDGDFDENYRKITAAAVSPDGEHLIIATRDNDDVHTVSLIDAAESYTSAKVLDVPGDVLGIWPDSNGRVFMSITGKNAAAHELSVMKLGDVKPTKLGETPWGGSIIGFVRQGRFYAFRTQSEEAGCTFYVSDGKDFEINEYYFGDSDNVSGKIPLDIYLSDDGRKFIAALSNDDNTYTHIAGIDTETLIKTSEAEIEGCAVIYSDGMNTLYDPQTGELDIMMADGSRRTLGF